MAIRVFMSSGPACAPIRSRWTRSTLPLLARSISINYYSRGRPPPSSSAATSPAMRGRSIRLLENLPPVIKAGDPDSDAGSLANSFVLQ